MARGILFSPNSWQHYLYWLQTDRDIHAKLIDLINDCTRDPFKGLGKPEALKHDLAGFWSRRITDEHRLVYGIKQTYLEIVQCRFHYAKK